MPENTTCGCCGNPTIPPYTGSDGHRYEGHYCEGCGTAWERPSDLAPNSCLLHRSGGALDACL